MRCAAGVRLAVMPKKSLFWDQKFLAFQLACIALT
jgi:hypothetical protein